jgi:uncharacterized protein YpmB
LGLDIVFITIIILLVIMLFVLLSINIFMSRQLKQNKALEDAIYRLIELTKQNQKN